MEANAFTEFCATERRLHNRPFRLYTINEKRCLKETNQMKLNALYNSEYTDNGIPLIEYYFVNCRNTIRNIIHEKFVYEIINTRTDVGFCQAIKVNRSADGSLIRRIYFDYPLNKNRDLVKSLFIYQNSINVVFSKCLELQSFTLDGQFLNFYVIKVKNTKY